MNKKKTWQGIKLSGTSNYGDKFKHSNTVNMMHRPLYLYYKD